jgi:hypothetical protein
MILKEEMHDTTVLRPLVRIEFDPHNPEHRAAYVQFERTGRWGIHFKAEWPCVTVPQTVLKKLAALACASEIDAFTKGQNEAKH